MGHHFPKAKKKFLVIVIALFKSWQTMTQLVWHWPRQGNFHIEDYDLKNTNNWEEWPTIMIKIFWSFWLPCSSHDKRWHSWWGIWKSGDPVVRDRRWQRDIRSKHDHLVGDLQGENEMTKFQQSTWILKQILICIWWDNLHKTTS